MTTAKARRKRQEREERGTGDTDGSWARMTGGALGAFSTPQTARAAENLSAVLGCVQAIAGAVSTFPLYCYREDGQTRVEDRTHPLSIMRRRGPNRYQTMVDWIEWMLASALLRGNAVSEVLRDGTGRVTGLMPIPWEWCRPSMLQNGAIVYDVNEITALYGGTGRSRRLTEDEVVHLRDRSDDGVIGISRLTRAYGALSAAMSVQDYDNQLWSTGLRPSGVLTMTRAMTPDQLDQLSRRMNQNFGGQQNAGRTMVLDPDMKWEGVSISPHDAELLLSRRFTVEEIARIFGVPPVVIGDLTNGSFNNTETLLLAFAQVCLRGWVTKLEAVLSRAIFSDEDIVTHSIEFDMSDFLRGDPATRWRNNQAAVDSGILTANEIRTLEGFGPIAGGDVLSPRQAATQPPKPGGSAAGTEREAA